MDRAELKKIASIYKEQKTFVHLREKTSEGFVKWYHGYVISIKEDFLMFKDRYIYQEFPVLFESIIKLEPSEQKEEVKG